MKFFNDIELVAHGNDHLSNPIALGAFGLFSASVLTVSACLCCFLCIKTVQKCRNDRHRSDIEENGNGTNAYHYI
jgi:hypothetical protein